jgi:hydrogenase maturation factor HypF (carbamoyltransferase family)
MSRIKFIVPKCICGRLAVAIVEDAPYDRCEFGKVPRCLLCAKEFKNMADKRQKEIDRVFGPVFRGTK